MINLVGNIGSLAGPYTIGWIRAHSESFAAPVWFVSTVMILGAVLLIFGYKLTREKIAQCQAEIDRK